MAPRNRSKANKDLPHNLYTDGDCFRYKNPVTGKFHGFGSDRLKAIAAAKQLNSMLAPKSDLISKVLRENDLTWSQLIERFIAIRQSKENKKLTTTREENYRLQHIRRDLGSLYLDQTTQKQISDYLENNYQNNAYTKHRGTLIKLMEFGIAKGMFRDGFKNLAASTLPEREPVKIRKVLTHEQYCAIHDVAAPWLKVAMDFALITLQRLSDVVEARYSDIEGDYLKVIQNKTERHGERAFLRIKIGEGLSEILQQSRKLPPLCPYIIHRMPARKIKDGFDGQDHWAQVRNKFLSKAFTAARDETGLFDRYEPGEAPTFHEIRGLGGKLYLEQDFSKEYVNLLMGHTTQRVTDQYTEQHINWTNCAADLKARF